jgi:hypothetical protein
MHLDRLCTCDGLHTLTTQLCFDDENFNADIFQIHSKCLHLCIVSISVFYIELWVALPLLYTGTLTHQSHRLPELLAD